MGGQIGAVAKLSLDEARACAMRALSLEPSLSAAHGHLGAIAACEGNWIESEGHYRRGFEGSAIEAMFYSAHLIHILFPTGHLTRATEEAEQAFNLAPASPLTNIQCALAASIAGDRERALARCVTAVELGFPESQPPLSAIRAQAACDQGLAAEAAKWMTLTMAPPLRAAGGAAVAELVYASICGDGSPEFAARAVDHLLQAPGVETVMSDWSVTAAIMIDWYTRLGFPDRAYGIADRMIDDWQQCGRLDVMSLMPIWTPQMLPFRRDPRFNGFVTRLGLIPYWEKFGPPDGCELRDRVLIVE
jgi:hypothetical protein